MDRRAHGDGSSCQRAQHPTTCPCGDRHGAGRMASKRARRTRTRPVGRNDTLHRGDRRSHRLWHLDQFPSAFPNGGGIAAGELPKPFSYDRVRGNFVAEIPEPVISSFPYHIASSVLRALSTMALQRPSLPARSAARACLSSAITCRNFLPAAPSPAAIELGVG